MDLNVQHNKFIDNNNAIGVGDEKEYEFYSVNNVRDDYKLEDDTHQLLNIIVRMDSEKIHYSRQIYTFLDIIADIGGFMELIKFLFYYSVSVFSVKHFMSSIMKQMYYKEKSFVKKKIDWNRVHNISSSLSINNRADDASADIDTTDVNVSCSHDKI